MYCLTCFSLLAAKSPNIPQWWCQSSQTLQIKYWEILYCFLTKASGGDLLSTSIWMGNCPSPGKNSVKYSLWNNLSLNVPETCFATRLLNDSISWVASNHKMSGALSTQKTGWSSSLPLLPPQVPSSYSVIQVEHHTHTWTLLLPILPNTSPNSTSQEVSCFSWWNWWSLSFLQIKINTSSVYY